MRVERSYSGSGVSGGGWIAVDLPHAERALGCNFIFWLVSIRKASRLSLRLRGPVNVQSPGCPPPVHKVLKRFSERCGSELVHLRGEKNPKKLFPLCYVMWIIVSCTTNCNKTFITFQRSLSLVIFGCGSTLYSQEGHKIERIPVIANSTKCLFKSKTGP